MSQADELEIVSYSRTSGSSAIPGEADGETTVMIVSQ